MLTKQDKTDIQSMIDKSLNSAIDDLMSRIISALSNFVTKSDLALEIEKLPTREEFNELKADVNDLKDDFGGVKQDLSNFIVLADKNLKIHERDIEMLKLKVGVA